MPRQLHIKPPRGFGTGPRLLGVTAAPIFLGACRAEGIVVRAFPDSEGAVWSR